MSLESNASHFSLKVNAKLYCKMVNLFSGSVGHHGLQHPHERYLSGSEADAGSGSESTDSLLDEAREYLKVAQTKLVSIEDWSNIEHETKMKKKQKKRVKHSPNSASFCEFQTDFKNRLCSE